MFIDIRTVFSISIITGNTTHAYFSNDPVAVDVARQLLKVGKKHERMSFKSPYNTPVWSLLR